MTSFCLNIYVCRDSSLPTGLHTKARTFGSLKFYFAGSPSFLDETLQGPRSAGHRRGELSAQGPPET